MNDCYLLLTNHRLAIAMSALRDIASRKLTHEAAPKVAEDALTDIDKAQYCKACGCVKDHNGCGCNPHDA